MPWQDPPLLIFFQVAALLSAVIALYAFWYVRSNRRSRLAIAIGVMAALEFVWLTAATLKVASVDLETKLWFYRLQFPGSLAVPSALLAVALLYAGYERYLTRPAILGLVTVPVVGTTLVFLDPGTLLIVDPRTVAVAGSYVTLEHDFGPAFQMLMGWTLGATLASAVLVVQAAVRGSIPRRPAAFVAAAILLPLSALGLKVLDIYPPGGSGFSVTPAVNAAGLLCLSVAVVRYRLFEWSPIGRRRAVEVMRDGYLLVGQDCRVLDANPAASRVLAGDESATVVGRDLSSVVPAIGDASAETHGLTIDGGHGEARTVTMDGRILQLVPSPVHRREEAVGTVMIVRDLTEQRAYVERLEDRNRRLQALFRNTTAAVVEYVVRDGEPIVVDVNEQFESVFGYDAETLVGRPVDEFIVPPEAKDEADDLNERVERGAPLDREVVRVTADGERTFLLRNAAIDTEGETRGYASYLDITERTEYERRLESRTERLEVLNRLVRHDINNDMTVVSGMVELAREDVDDEAVRDRLDRALAAADHVTDLTRTARDLMEAMLAESHELEPIALRAVVVSAVDDATSSDDPAVRIDGEIPDVEVLADDLLSSVFRNLLDNALRHNDKPDPTVTVSASADADRVRVVVADNGPGIPPAQRDRVFGKGERGRDSTGTGIGLFLVSSLVDSYGGDVRIDPDRSTPGPSHVEGTAFVVELDRARE